MSKIVAIACGALAVGTLAAAVGTGVARADAGGPTVTAGAFTVQWSATDPEEITSLSWNGSPNLTNAWAHPFCPQGGDHEFFGNSWDTDGGFFFRALVGWGSTGTWDDRVANGVAIASAATAG